MKRIAIISALLAVTVSSCSKKENLGDEIPICVRTMISELETDSNVRDGTTVTVYLFQNRHVYVHNIGNVAFVYDKKCNMIGLLGGFAGNMEVNGEDFSNARLIREIWRR
ncbi:MAG TPA: hypothetical protein VNQ80_17850 [Parapedobacter sp.]|uniref:DUF6970 domain-containing protein n=1 Tax=Parapedobacter sp. TaxID=1958893 RepID=UPI002CAB06A4|nr:hypothetical protein [Parapedobacter sp.]HWK59212.1 hypothetical protein [Parapedobacter sp.]